MWPGIKQTMPHPKNPPPVTYFLQPHPPRTFSAHLKLMLSTDNQLFNTRVSWGGHFKMQADLGQHQSHKSTDKWQTNQRAPGIGSTIRKSCHKWLNQCNRQDVSERPIAPIPHNAWTSSTPGNIVTGLCLDPCHFPTIVLSGIYTHVKDPPSNTKGVTTH